MSIGNQPGIATTVARYGWNANQVPSITEPSPREFAEHYLLRGQPVKLAGLCQSWDAYSRWNDLYFRRVAGERPVLVEVYPEGRFSGVKRRSEMLLSAYLDYLARADQQTARYYLADLSIGVLPELMADINLPPVVDLQRLRAVRLYLGQDSLTPAHYHPTEEALLCQIVGEKRIILFAPEESACLYPKPFFSPNFHFSRIDFEHPVAEAFPRLERARVLECVLRPGDALFIPVHWWHVVYGHERSVSVTFFWKAQWRCWKFPAPGIRTLAGMMTQRLRQTARQATHRLNAWRRPT